MSHLLDRLQFFKKKQGEFADGHGETSNESRAWEGAYRQRWQHDKIVRSTHGVNCTGSCSWKIYVKNGLITWETQQTDYPRTRPDLPNHEPRGCPRGASYSWYIYSANRLKYPKVRKPLLKLWREARAQHGDPVNAWASIVEDAAKAKSYKSQRGLGGFVRSSWDEVTEIIAAANVYTAKTYGPDRVIGFSPIPAMSMVSYAAGARYLSLIGGVCLSFYDWYCDLPPASPQIWGEQTDVPESADWYNSSYIIAWGSNVPQTRTPDAHFFTEVRYKGTKTVSITPDYSEVAKLTDLWLNPKQGTDAALGMAFGHVILKEFHLDRPSAYFVDYCRQYTDMPMLVLLEEHAGGAFKPTRYLRAADLADNLGQDNNPEWKTIAYDERSGGLVSPTGAIGYRWGESGKWNIAELDGRSGDQTRLQLSLLDGPEHACEVAFPYFAGQEHPHFKGVANDEVLLRRVPFREIVAADGKRLRVATVYDLQMANYSIDRGLGGDNVATSYEDADTPYTPAWQERITGVPAARATQVAREFADSADKTRGKAMVIIGAAMNHWYHMDMNYRAVINMLMMCGCIGQSGGGWAHYVGQEKLRPQTGWAPLAFGLDWSRPPRQMNGTSFFYLHSSQWRHEKLSMHEVLSPLADASRFAEHALDYNIQAERLGWLPSAPQLNRNPLRIAAEAEAAGLPVADYVVRELKSGGLRFASESPDDPQNFPRNMFIWRSNLLGSSGKGHEYMLKYLLGAKNGVMNDDLGKAGGPRPTEVDWVDDGAEGKLDLVTTLDFRMSSTCMYSDIVLPTATWYEKDDLNTSDMHPFIHPLSAATDPAWEAKSDWEIYKAIAKKFSAVAEGHLGVEQDLVTVPLLHDTPTELAQPFGGDGHDWKKGECEPMPGRNLPTLHLVERDYPNVYRKFTSLGPLLDKLGNGGKGIGWNTEKEVKLVGDLNHRVVESGVSQGRPRIDSAIDAAEVVLALAPETNGQVAVKAWEALSKITGREHAHLALPKEDEKIRFRDIQVQPRKIISSPTWSGLEDEHVSYNAGYTNVHELIPWRTITGRQQFYQDHPWMQAFGEGFVSYRPPVNTRTTEKLLNRKPNGNPEITLNWITPHQKWGIHSTYSDNLLMLTLSRGGPIIWLSEHDAAKAGIVDNDWVEVFNANGAATCRAVVSQRVKDGMVMMYHAQERIVNVPGSETTGTRGGHHNSVTRVVLKPTHMIGGYAQQAWGFNYYDTVGCNRDEFVVVRKMSKVDWLDEPRHGGLGGDALPQPLPQDI
ncbi:nitrate reductase subunit alpha [Pseudomonas aeruginosa]|uniref:nitrate reductase subunit alpha n=1 Tax=Pseudomonas aeruginosa TaxID=287 RepID=UPI000F7F5C5F|nr:nitrate reductase subunit alpha [Pseudomonas aeruginosa]MCT5521998.1 nitrate reductase subunit alpha [Pseudomonas aeruginosa]RTB65361.1 nitrate reductase subunit alpha [Pseudomonas aeruginosa]HEJ1326663.1 nitrate reductase subunit alpha [Pseudomonas aeruginosa]HEJ3723673.1 nitrate reductase subunit alpha [Pseudomonas aeruginosa]HEQ0044732.1 nitrate reductase subunit alpha [Pseudomonas aeruginosa]